MIRVAHLSDLHVTSGPRLADHEAVLLSVVRSAISADVHCWLITGDLYGHTVPHRSTPDERLILHRAIAMMAAHGPVVVIAGNHDHAVDLEGLRYLGGLWPVEVYDQAEDVEIVTPAGSIDLYALPYPTKRWLLAGQQVPPGVGAAQAMVEERLQGLLRGWGMLIRDRRARRPGVPQVLAAHLQVAGSTAGAGVVLAGQEIEITRADLEELAPDYGALGHLHELQEAAQRCWYAGSLWNTAHSTAKPRRRVWLLLTFGREVGMPPADYNAGAVDYPGAGVPLRLEPQDSGARPFVTLTYRWGVAEDGAPCWLERPDIAITDGAEVRMRLIVPAQHVASSQHAWQLELERVGLDAGRVVEERVIEPSYRARSTAVAVAMGPAAKLEAYWATLSAPPAAAEQTQALELLGELADLDDEQIEGAALARMEEQE